MLGQSSLPDSIIEPAEQIGDKDMNSIDSVQQQSRRRPEPQFASQPTHFMSMLNGHGQAKSHPIPIYDNLVVARISGLSIPHTGHIRVSWRGLCTRILKMWYSNANDGRHRVCDDDAPCGIACHHSHWRRQNYPWSLFRRTWGGYHCVLSIWRTWVWKENSGWSWTIARTRWSFGS